MSIATEVAKLASMAVDRDDKPDEFDIICMNLPSAKFNCFPVCQA